MFSRCLWDMSLRRLEDVFSVTIFRFPRRLQDALWDVVFRTSSKPLAKSKIATLKTCWRRLLHISWRRLQDVLKINKCLLRRPLQDVFKTSSRRLQRRLQNIFKTSCKNFFKTSSKRLQDIFKMSSRHLQDIFKTAPRYLQDVLQRCLPDVFKAYYKVKLFLVIQFQRNFTYC